MFDYNEIHAKDIYNKIIELKNKINRINAENQEFEVFSNSLWDLYKQSLTYEEKDKKELVDFGVTHPMEKMVPVTHYYIYGREIYYNGKIMGRPEDMFDIDLVRQKAYDKIEDQYKDDPLIIEIDALKNKIEEINDKIERIKNNYENAETRIGIPKATIALLKKQKKKLETILAEKRDAARKKYEITIEEYVEEEQKLFQIIKERNTLLDQKLKSFQGKGKILSIYERLSVLYKALKDRSFVCDPEDIDFLKSIIADNSQTPENKKIASEIIAAAKKESEPEF